MNKFDNEKIDKLYKLGATEMPTKEIDLAILNEAKKARSEVKYVKKWRYWMPVAASMVLVSLVYFDNQPKYINNLEIESAPLFKKNKSPLQDESLFEVESEKGAETTSQESSKDVSQEGSLELNEIQSAPNAVQESIAPQGIEYKAPEVMQRSKAAKVRSSGAVDLELTRLDSEILKNIDDLIEEGSKEKAKKLVLALVKKQPNMKIELKKLYTEFFEGE